MKVRVRIECSWLQKEKIRHDVAARRARRNQVPDYALHNEHTSIPLSVQELCNSQSVCNKRRWKYGRVRKI